MAVKDENREEKSRYTNSQTSVDVFITDTKRVCSNAWGQWWVRVLYFLALALGILGIVSLPAFDLVVKVAASIVWLVAEFIMYVLIVRRFFIDVSISKSETKDVMVDTKGTIGTAAEANDSAGETNDEMEDIFEAGDYYEQLKNICGVDPKDPRRLYSVRRNRGMNGNVIIFGSPGSGKSVTIAIPTIMQTIRRGESLIVTDPKGELYDKTSIMAKAHGYTVKVFNISPSMMVHSDSVNFMGVIDGDDLKAESFVRTIMENCGGVEDFFDKQELNLLKALVLLHTQDGTKLDPTLAGVYKHLVQSTAEDLMTEFEDLTWDSPAMGPGMAFASSGDRVMGDTKGGLAVRLGTLNNRILQKIVGEDDIDFTLPGREKCIYYIVSDDTDVTMSFYQSLFFTLLFQELKNYADNETGKAKSLPVKVTFLMDEFPSIGIIPGFQKALATFRGRNMDIIMILQNLGQLQKMYPDNEWASIIDCCSTMYLLRTNDIEITAKHISNRAGIQSVVGDADTKEMIEKAKLKPLKRNVMNPDEVVRLKNDEMLVIVSGHNVARIKKNYYFTHPMCKELRDTNVSHHVPKWMLDVIMSNDKTQLKRFGIKTADQARRWVSDINFEKELLESVTLCTPDDFKEPWNNDKQRALDKMLTGEVDDSHIFKDEDGNPVEADISDIVNKLASVS